MKDSVITHPLPARPDQLIEFYLAESYYVSHDDGPYYAAPEIVVVGPQSYRRTRLFLSGEIDVFTIRFQPGGFNALFRIDMSELVNQGVDARDIIGERWSRLRSAVLGAADFDKRVMESERLIYECMDTLPPSDPVANAALVLLRAGGQMRIDALARCAGLSDRQFVRRFTTQVGLPPKFYARTIRFNAVLAAKEAQPEASWTDLIYGAGYVDQAHFIRESHEFGGAAPARFFAEWANQSGDGLVQSRPGMPY